MSQPRSGLLSGLVVGFVATLVCAIAQAAILLYGDLASSRLPSSTAGDGLWAMTTIAFTSALLLSVLVCLFRPGQSAGRRGGRPSARWRRWPWDGPPPARRARRPARLSLDRLMTNFPAELAGLWPS